MASVSACHASGRLAEGSSRINIAEAIDHYRAVAAELTSAISAAAPVGEFTAEPGYRESRDICSVPEGPVQVWIPTLRATGADPGGDAFWAATWPAASQAAAAAGFTGYRVCEDRRGAHVVELTDEAGGLVTLMARPAASPQSATWTTVAVRTGCHPQS